MKPKIEMYQHITFYGVWKVSIDDFVKKFSQPNKKGKTYYVEMGIEDALKALSIKKYKIPEMEKQISFALHDSRKDVILLIWGIRIGEDNFMFSLNFYKPTIKLSEMIKYRDIIYEDTIQHYLIQCIQEEINYRGQDFLHQRLKFKEYISKWNIYSTIISTPILLLIYSLLTFFLLYDWIGGIFYSIASILVFIINIIIYWFKFYKKESKDFILSLYK